MRVPPGQPLRIAIVAASLRILGGQAVQAQRLLDAWRDDPAIDAWLVPINPVPPRPIDAALKVTYLRTLVTQLWYWPLLVREVSRADVVHVFSASSSSFLLAPPRYARSRACRRNIQMRASRSSALALRNGRCATWSRR